MKLFSTLFVIAFAISSSATGQDTLKRELGLRTSSLNNFGFIYKKQIRENVYRRHRLAFGNLSLNFVGGNSIIGFSVGGATGKERRRNINDKLQFIYGTELIASVNLNSASSGTIRVDNGNGSYTQYEGTSMLIVTPSVGIGFVLGAQYNFNSRWYVSGELIPSVEVGVSFGNITPIYRVNAGFTSSSVGLTGAYRF